MAQTQIERRISYRWQVWVVAWIWLLGTGLKSKLDKLHITGLDSRLDT